MVLWHIAYRTKSIAMIGLSLMISDDNMVHPSDHKGAPEGALGQPMAADRSLGGARRLPPGPGR